LNYISIDTDYRIWRLYYELKFHSNTQTLDDTDSPAVNCDINCPLSTKYHKCNMKEKYSIVSVYTATRAMVSKQELTLSMLSLIYKIIFGL
jgi:hypothetical protein